MAIAEIERRSPARFDYQAAFSRNIGWITEPEQDLLRCRTVAIAGVGGVGGHYCEVLARLGVQNFHIADFDRFEVQNFNRQNASGISTLDRPKVEVLRERILDINPLARVRMFDAGVSEMNIADFLRGADLYLDGLDFFQFAVRQMVFRSCREAGVPAITVAPVGMGAALIVFDQDSMKFEDYFGFDQGLTTQEKALRFLVGLTPSLLQNKYLVKKDNVKFDASRAPSTPMGCYLCAGVAGSTALKILLGRGPVAKAPWSIHFDSYRQVLKKKYLWRGYRNPIQRLKLWIIRRILAS